MSHSPNFYWRGMRKTDEDFLKMIEVRDACYKAGIPVPEAVYEYFGRRDIDHYDEDLRTMKFGSKIIAIDGGSGDIMENETDKSLLVEELAGDMRRHYMLNLKALPTELETLEIEITW